MVDRLQIQPLMEVIAADGSRVGRVDGVEGQAIRLAAEDAPDGRHHLIPLEWVARVDAHVHLNVGSEALAGLRRPAASGPGADTPGVRVPGAAGAGAALGAAALGAGGRAEPSAAAVPPSPIPPPSPAAAPSSVPKDDDGSATALPPVRNPAVRGARPRGNYYLPWILGLILAVLLLVLLVRSCDTEKRGIAGDPAPAATTGEEEPARDRPAPLVTDLTTGTVAYALNEHLATGEAGERSFTFDRLNFPTGSSRLRREDRQDIDDIARVLLAYPAARIAVVGYTDARGRSEANARLGHDRANAIVGALAERGVQPQRMVARSGGEADPVATNAAESGRAENRRTELILLGR